MTGALRHRRRNHLHNMLVRFPRHNLTLLPSFSTADTKHCDATRDGAGGFSVYGGAGGAAEVTTLDISKPAVEAAAVNWALNGLPPAAHRGVAADAFEFLEQVRDVCSVGSVCVTCARAVCVCGPPQATKGIRI